MYYEVYTKDLKYSFSPLCLFFQKNSHLVAKLYTFESQLYFFFSFQL